MYVYTLIYLGWRCCIYMAVWMQTWGITKTAVTQLKFACPWHSDATASEISKMEVVHLMLLVPRKRSPLLQTLVDFSILIFFLVALGFRISYYASVWSSVGSGNYTCPVHNHCVVQKPNVFFLVVFFHLSSICMRAMSMSGCLQNLPWFWSLQEPTVSYALSHLDSFRDAPWTRFYGTPQSHHSPPPRTMKTLLETSGTICIFDGIFLFHVDSFWLLTSLHLTHPWQTILLMAGWYSDKLWQAHLSLSLHNAIQSTKIIG